MTGSVFSVKCLIFIDIWSQVLTAAPHDTLACYFILEESRSGLSVWKLRRFLTSLCRAWKSSLSKEKFCDNMKIKRQEVWPRPVTTTIFNYLQECTRNYFLHSIRSHEACSMNREKSRLGDSN